MKQLLVLGSVAALAITSLHLDPPQAARTPDSWMRVTGEHAKPKTATTRLAWRDAHLPAHASTRLSFDALAPSRVQSMRTELAKPDEDDGTDYADIRQRLAWLLTALRHQRARESDLIYEAYDDAFDTEPTLQR